MNNELIISKEKIKAPTTQIVLDKKQQNWWNSLTQKQRDIIVSFAMVLGISAVGFITIKFASRKIREAISNNAENSSFGESDHTTWAKQLKMAFDNDGWWGTDEKAVRRVLLAIPSQEDFKKVQIQYRKLYKGKNLIVDMTGELQTPEYNEMLAILQAKPEKAKDAIGGRIYDPYGWAKRLYNAMSIYYVGVIPGTDEDAILTVFSEMKTKKEFADTKEAYQSLYNTSMEDDLDGDLNWSIDWRAIINKKSDY
tara:strand:- start:146 stop:904 length:759 start_codon:yes stop_codon:yes gene_type:complete